MFSTLVASDSKSRRRTMTPGTMVVSIVFHGLLLAGGVYASVQPPVEEVKKEEEVTFVTVEDDPPPPPESAVEPPPMVLAELVPPLVPPPVIPMADPSQPLINLDAFSGVGPTLSVERVAGPPVSSVARDSSFAYQVQVLDAPPTLRNESEVVAAMERAYPGTMLQAGIGGTVRMRFVIQPDGSVDPSSIQVLSASNERFENASRDVVGRFRYNPGLYKGEPVRVLVETGVTWRPEL